MPTPNLSGARILQMPKPHTPPTTLPIIAAHPLKQRQKPFEGRLISRNGRTIKRFGTLAWVLMPLIDAEAAILDGEFVTKDASGRPIFLDLMRPPNDASYIGFDLPWLDKSGSPR